MLVTGLAYGRASHNEQAEADLQVGKVERMISETRLEAAVRVLARAHNVYVSVLDYEGMMTSWAKTAEAYRSDREWDHAFKAYEEARAICADLAL